MKAVVYRRYGSPDELALREVALHETGDGEVRVEVCAASINSWDWDLVVGRPLARLGGLRRPAHPILGCDVSGRVEALGPDVRGLRVGDEVFGDLSRGAWGGFAEFVCADERALAKKPASMSFEDAAALPQAGVLALQGLRHRGPLRPGQRVLINGAGGGVGTFALQIARHFGAEVTCVDRAEKLARLRSLGADRVLDFACEDFTAKGPLFDLVLDVVGHRSVFELRRALAPEGVYVMVGGTAGRILQVLLLGPWIRRLSGRKLGLLLHRPDRRDLDSLGELYESGALRPVIDRRCALRDVPDGLRALGEGRVFGKIVVAVNARAAPPSPDGR